MAKISIFTSVREWAAKKLAPDDFAFRPQPENNWRGLIKSWEDRAYEINRDAYRVLLSNDVVVQPMHKFAERLAGMQLTVVGSGKRRDKLQEIVDRTSGVGDMLYWLAYARIEGVRFVRKRAVLDESDGLFIGDFRGCGARKWKAGGNLYWAGWQADVEEPNRSIGKLEELSNGDPEDKIDAEGAWYERKDWIVFRPGSGTNPEGDTELTYQLFLLAESAQLLDKAMRIYADRYALPRELLKQMIDALRPDEKLTLLKSGASKLAASNARKRSSMSAETVIELIEPKGTTWEFLTSYRSLMERRAHRLVFGEDITSGGQESGDRGGREQGNKQAFAAVTSFGKRIADTLTEEWLPWIAELNKDELPELADGEPTPYLDIRPSAEKERLSVAELVQAADRRIPLKADDVYATLGVDRPPETDDVFRWEHIGGQNAGNIPSNTGESTQRRDREQEDSNLPAEKPQDENEDLRNVDEDTGDED